MNRLQGEIAVITSGTSGLGLAAADAFLREGARVVVGPPRPLIWIAGQRR